MNYEAPRWLAGGHLQTIWPAVYLRHRPLGTPLALRRERWDTPDGDFIDVDWLAELPLAADSSHAGTPERPLLVMFHGLEGSSTSHYARAFARDAAQRGWAFALPHFRGCSGELNRLPRAYHSGDHAEIDWVLRRLSAQHAGPLLVVGVSLGGNALMLWAGLQGAGASKVVSAAAAICAPLDLAAAGHAIGRGFGRRSYTPMFLKTMKHKALLKLKQFPGLFDAKVLAAARTLHRFDDVFTAPLHGFDGVDDYWARASAKPHLAKIALPTLLVNSLNDPFVPAASLPGPDDVSDHVTLWQPREGGHVGFAQGRLGLGLGALPQSVNNWLATFASVHADRSAQSEGTEAL